MLFHGVALDRNVTCSTPSADSFIAPTSSFLTAPSPSRMNVNSGKTVSFERNVPPLLLVRESVMLPFDVLLGDSSTFIFHRCQSFPTATVSGSVLSSDRADNTIGTVAVP